MVIASGRMLGKTELLSADSGRGQLMAGDLLDVGAVDDQFLLSDAYRQQFANALPRHGVEVLQIRHMTFRVHRPVEDLGGIVGSRRQTQQVRFLFLIEIDGPRLVSQCECTSAISASQSTAVSLRCSSDVK